MKDIDYSGWPEYVVPERWTIASTIVAAGILSELMFPGAIGWFYELLRGRPAFLVRISTDEFLLLAGMVAIHEGIHGLVFLLRGYRPRFGIRIS